MLRRLDAILFYALLAAALGLGGWLLERHNRTWDWSAGARNSLSETSRALLARLEGPLRITSFTPAIPELRRQIQEVVGRYQRERPDIELTFIDPDTHPELTRQLGIQVSGELRLEYQGRSANLRSLTEQELSNAIQRLVLQQGRWVAFLIGHGERRLDGKANHDLGDFGAELQRKGYPVQPLELAATPQIPDNTALLVVASPQASLLPGEVERLLAFVAGGGNLLWLLDPGPLYGLQPLVEHLGLEIVPGTVVDPGGTALGLRDATIALGARYPAHPATPGFDLLTLYPHAAPLQGDPASPWLPTPLVQTRESAWIEQGALEGALRLDIDRGEQPGPLTLGLALSQAQGEREQRVVVMGDGDFLSNRWLGNGGNLDLGLNLVRWLAGDERLLAIPARTAPDLTLQLSEGTTALIGLGLFLGIPGLLLGGGLWTWWRRRRL
jgi:ABC-type uncharacterized transport system involved in gliding motility auxiliary subunit